MSKSEIVLDLFELYNKGGRPFEFEFKIPKLTTYAGNVKRDVTYLITGRSGSGKTSFVDCNFVINTYLQWRLLEEQERPPFKIIYYGLKTSLAIKMQKWACSIIYKRDSLIVDIPTLNNEPGRIFDPSDAKFKLSERVKAAAKILEDLEKHVIFRSKTNITGIETDIQRNCPSQDDTDNTNSYSFVIVDNTERIAPEYNGHNLMTQHETNKYLSETLHKLHLSHSFTAVIIHPTRGFIRGVQDSEPKFSDMEVFEGSSNVCFGMYNPYNERNYNYKGYDINEWTFNRGINRFRGCMILKNDMGVDNMLVPLTFIPECGIFIKAPESTQDDDIIMLHNLLTKIK